MKGERTVLIGGYDFTVRFVDRREIDGCEGKAFINERLIEIRDDLDRTATRLVLTHEVVHVILGTQGRASQRRFSDEEMCEFIAYRLPEINHVIKEVERCD